MVHLFTWHHLLSVSCMTVGVVLVRCMCSYDMQLFSLMNLFTATLLDYSCLPPLCSECELADYKTEEVSVELSCFAGLSSSSSLMFVRMLHYCHPLTDSNLWDSHARSFNYTIERKKRRCWSDLKVFRWMKYESSHVRLLIQLKKKKQCCQMLITNKSFSPFKICFIFSTHLNPGP